MKKKRRLFKIIIYIMILSMLLSTILMSVAYIAA